MGAHGLIQAIVAALIEQVEVLIGEQRWAGQKPRRWIFQAFSNSSVPEDSDGHTYRE